MSAETAISADTPVGPEVPLYRLIPAEQCSAVNGEWEFQSAAFDNSSGTDEMSVVLGDTLQVLERVPEDLPSTTVLEGGRERWGVAVIAAAAAFEEEQEIRRTPQVEEPAHGDVVGTKAPGRRRRLKKRAAWVCRPARPAS